MCAVFECVWFTVRPGVGRLSLWLFPRSFPRWITSELAEFSP